MASDPRAFEQPAEHVFRRGLDGDAHPGLGIGHSDMRDTVYVERVTDEPRTGNVVGILCGRARDGRREQPTEHMDSLGGKERTSYSLLASHASAGSELCPLGAG